ncbi:hypothetical protein KY349_05000 [Candidatus Woesearchaeota archaeon]|nr:hypothetical protein [Candidatus Woesearchaeota archaeon]
MKRNILIILFVVSLLLLAGCEEEDKQPKVKEMVERPVQKEQPEPEPEPEIHAVEEPEPEPEPEFVPEPFCGDNNCDSDENCDSCFNDCACISPAECHRGECVVPECGSNTDCKDDDACTYDRCYFAQHVNAYCGHEPVKTCRDDDNCCPKGCNANEDDDCESDCGNDICEEGEDIDDCPEDCTQPECGNGDCESGEDATSCPADCV